MNETEWRIAEVQKGHQRTLSDDDFQKGVRRITGLLEGLGLPEEGRVALFMDNCIENFQLRMACVGLKLQPVLINIHFTASEISYILRDCQAQALFALGSHAKVLKEATNGFVDLQGRIFLSSYQGSTFHNFQDALSQSPEAHRPWHELPRSIIYTSGTTGNPKGVVRQPATDEDTQRVLNLFRNILELGNNPIHLVTGPLHHSGPMSWSNVAYMLGGKLVIMKRFDPELLLETVERFRVTNMHLVPTMMHRLLDLPEETKRRYDLSSLVSVQHGAAPCPPMTKTAMIKWWGPVIHEYYGSTEAGLVTYIKALESQARPTSVGRVSEEDFSVKIVHPDGQELPPFSVGDIWVKTSYASGFSYHNDPDKLERSMTGDFFKSGDMGYMDNEGFLYICDRRVDMIISGGVNIYPAEVEAALVQHPDIEDCAVIGVPNEEWGESVHAVIQTKHGLELCLKDLQRFVGKDLARYKFPKTLQRVESLPRQTNGKIYKQKLRQGLDSQDVTASPMS